MTEKIVEQTFEQPVEQMAGQTVEQPPKKIKPKMKIRLGGIDGAIAQTVIVLLLVLTLFLCMVPVLITIIMSLKLPEDIQGNPIWTLPKTQWAFANYKAAFNVLSGPLLWTLVMDIAVSVTVMIMSCYIAFLFQWYKFKGNKVLFALFILPMLVPNVVLLSPTYIVAFNLGITGSYWGVILPYLAGNQIASVFMLRVFMGQHPKSLYEAAQLDGANKFNLFVYVCLPLSFPIMMVQGIGIFAAIYNDYLWPQLIFQNDYSKGTIMPYLRSSLQGINQGIQYAMYLVAGIPLIISTAISIKFFVSGDFASGLKM